MAKLKLLFGARALASRFQLHAPHPCRCGRAPFRQPSVMEKGSTKSSAVRTRGAEDRKRLRRNHASHPCRCGRATVSTAESYGEGKRGCEDTWRGGQKETEENSRVVGPATHEMDSHSKREKCAKQEENMLKI